MQTEQKTVVINVVLDEEGFMDVSTVGITMIIKTMRHTQPMQWLYAWHTTTVLLNNSWKFPVAYFLIRSLDSEERANSINLALKDSMK